MNRTRRASQILRVFCGFSSGLGDGVVVGVSGTSQTQQIVEVERKVYWSFVERVFQKQEGRRQALSKAITRVYYYTQTTGITGHRRRLAGRRSQIPCGERHFRLVLVEYTQAKGTRCSCFFFGTKYSSERGKRGKRTRVVGGWG